MACRYYDDGDCLKMTRDELDRATRLLCKMVAHFGVIPGDAELAKWKEEHDEQDRRRVAAEQAEQTRKRERARQESIAAAAEELAALERVGGRR